MTEQPTPAGWYDDGSGRQRWWDGSQWGSFQDEAGTPPQPPTDLTQESQLVVIRRTRRAPFNPPDPAAPDASGVVVSRDWILGLRAAKAKQDSGLTRNRKIAGDLPEWSPLPPGELMVSRKSGKHR